MPSQPAVQSNLAVFLNALQGKAGALVLAAFVLYGAYNLLNNAVNSINLRVDRMTDKMEEISREVAGIRSSIDKQNDAIEGVRHDVIDHEARIRGLEQHGSK